MDTSPHPASLVAYLDKTAGSLAAMKQYVAAAVRRAVPGGIVLDIGCGAGHDLDLLRAAGLRPVGIDPSEAMLDAARERAGGAGLARADGARLPFRSSSLDGCRIERVLQHVEDPELILAEAARVLRPGGFLAVFEPDWLSIGFGGADPDDAVIAEAIVSARHPDIGVRLPGLIEDAGFLILDHVVEASRGRTFSRFPVNIEVQLARAVTHGRIDERRAARWLDVQAARERAGRFRGTWTKVLVVATRA